MKLNVDETLLIEYEKRLREAYRIYYNTLQKHGLAWYTEKGHHATKEIKDKLRELVEKLPHPDRASFAEMVIIGWWGTSWHYEYFYWCGKDGQTPKDFAETALHDLSMITYHNKDPRLRPLIDTIISGARFADDIGKVVGKYSK